MHVCKGINVLICVIKHLYKFAFVLEWFIKFMYSVIIIWVFDNINIII